MNESPALNSNEGHETPEERAQRFKEEEEELEQVLLKIGATGDAADILIEQLARKHKAESELNRVFATLDDFNEYEQKAASSNGEEDHAAAFPIESPTESDTAAEGSEPASPAPTDESEPTAEIVEAEPERPLTEEERAALVAELNAITDATIDEQRDIIVRYEADLADRVRNPKYTEAEYEEAQTWLTKPKELALVIAGKERLMNNVKIPDLAVMDAYEQKVNEKDPVKREAQKKAVPRQLRDAYREAFLRKKDFIQALMDSGVRKGMAYGLYNEFIDRAASLERFSNGLTQALENGESVVINKGDPDYDLLKWHGIKDGQWAEIIDQINAELKQFNTIPPPPEPERPARVVPLIRPTKEEKKEEAVVPPQPEEEKTEVVPPIPAPPLSGIYEVRDDGHVYNSGDASPDAPRLDKDEQLPRVVSAKKKGSPSGTTRPVSAPVLSAEDGVVTYDRAMDPDLAREEETLRALMKQKDLVRPTITYPQVPKGNDPRLTGLYNIDDGAVRTGLAEGEGEEIARTKDRTKEAHEEAMHEEPVDETVSQEVIDGWAEQGIIIPKDTKASDLGEILRKAGENTILEDTAPGPTENKLEQKTGMEAKVMEKFIALQKIYFAENAELIHKLDEAVAHGDSKKVAELEEERKERAETYENAIAEYQKSTGTIPEEEKEELAREAARKAYEEELDTYNVKETPEAPQGSPLYRELQKKAYVAAKYPDVAIVLKQLQDPTLSWEEFAEIVKNAENLEAIGLVASSGIYVSDHALWSMPHGRSLRIDWDMDGNVGLECTCGPEDIKQAEISEEVEQLEEKENLVIFDPEHELSKILKAPTGERRQMLFAYKEKLAQQKKGLAEVQAAMEEDIRTNPDMTREEFVQRYAERAAAYSATPEQKKIAEEIFMRYQQKHQAVESVREKYPDDKVLFAALFGVEPKGDIEVIKGPMTLYLRLHHAEDYALAYSGASLKNTPLVTPEMTEKAKNTGGCMLAQVLLPELSRCVMLENAQGKPFDESTKAIYHHEEQHAINQLFDWKKQRDIFAEEYRYSLKSAGNAMRAAMNMSAAEGDNASPHLMEIEKVKAEEKLENALVQYFRTSREHLAEGQLKAKDEILAYAKDGRSFHEVFKSLTRKRSENGLYDYLADSNFDSKKILEYAGLDEATASAYVQKVDAIKERVFGPEYHVLLREAMDAYEELRTEGYKEEAIRAILMEEPLGKWKKVVNRLIAQEEGIPEETLKKYEEQFNIGERDLKRIEGFRELTEGQQMLVLKELNNYSVARIKGEALREYREKYNALGRSHASATLSSKEQEFLQKGDWWRKLAVGMSKSVKSAAKDATQIGKKAGMALMKRKIIADREKELAGQMFNGEVDQKEFLTELVRQAKEGPDAEIVEGKIELKFLKDEDIGPELAPEFSARVEAFNRDAAAFANTPHAWREHTASKEEKAAYAKAEEQYRRARHEVLELKRLTSGDELASLDVIDLDRKVTLNQFFNTHPDAEEMLADIKDQKVWGKWMLETAQTRGGIMALGGAVRTAAGFVASQVVSKASLIAAPLAGAVVGGYRGRQMARTEIEERELLAKIGIVDSNEEARNIVDATKLTEKIYRLKDEIDAIPYTPDLSPELLERRMKLIESLDARYAYTREKIEKGLVNFGGAKSIANRYELLKAFGVAAAECEYNKLSNDDLHKRLRSFIDTKEELVDERQKAYVNERMRTAALYGAGFGYAGAFMADYFHGLYQFEGGVASGKGGTGGNLSGESGAEIVAPKAPSGEAAAASEAIEAAKRDGWMSDTVREMQIDAAQNKEYLDKIMELTGRKSNVGLSDMELNALQATDNDPARAAAHAALLEAMKQGRLSDDEVARIMLDQRIPSAAEEVSPAKAGQEAPVSVSEPHHGGEDVETIIHSAKDGDNLTNLMKGRLQIMEDLTPEQQENVVQNFIRRVTPEELRSIGISDASHIKVGDKIDIGKLNEVLLAKRINGQDLFAHARALEFVSEEAGGAEETLTSPEQPTSFIKETIGTLSTPETELIERFIGRSISGSESHVLHSMKSLSHLTHSTEESKFIDEAFTHLELAMREAGRPLTMAEMQRILAGHGSIDTLIKFSDVPSGGVSAEAATAVTAETHPLTPKTAESISPASTIVPPETVSLGGTPELTPDQIAHWNDYTEVQKLPLARTAAVSYLDSDTKRMFGTNMFGKASLAWLNMASRPATEIFGEQGEHAAGAGEAAPDPLAKKILEYAKEQGFVQSKGYVPTRGETVEQFLIRAHSTKVLERGPRTD